MVRHSPFVNRVNQITETSHEIIVQFSTKKAGWIAPAGRGLTWERQSDCLSGCANGYGIYDFGIALSEPRPNDWINKPLVERFTYHVPPR